MENDWLALIDNMESPVDQETRAAKIAAVLRSGNPSPQFCRMLAEMIDPNGKNATPFALILSRKLGGRPKGPDWRVGFEMERLIDTEGSSVDSAVFQVQQIFGVKGNSRSKCMAALKEARLFTEAAKLLDEVKENRKKS